MEIWQIVLMAFFLLLPFALLADFWPDKERLTSTGKPIDRDWTPQVSHGPADQH